MNDNIRRVIEDINKLTEEERDQISTRGRQDKMDTLIAIMRKVRFHMTHEKHEGCCMGLIEDILLGYALSGRSDNG